MFMTPNHEIAALRARVEQLMAENRTLRGMFVDLEDEDLRRAFALQPQELKLVSALRRASPNPLTYDALTKMIGAAGRNPKNCLKTRIVMVRKQLTAHGIEIGVLFGRGVFLDDANKARLEDAIKRGREP